MKSQLKKLPVTAFQPMELTIRIESERDLWNLWHRFNIYSSALTPSYKRDFDRSIDHIVPVSELWQQVENALVDLGQRVR